MELINGQYNIAGIPVEKLIEEFDTPLYVYDASVFERQYKRLFNAFPGVKVRLNYACKALTNIAVLQEFNKMGSGLDAVSIQEVWIALKSGFAPERILYTPNCVSMEEIDMAVKEGVRINIDNLSVLEQFGSKYGSKVPVCVRLNPHIMAGGNAHISVGHIDSKFGISIHQVRHISRIVKSFNIKVEGLHMHTGSDILDADVFLYGAELLFDAASEFPDLKYMDFGSGFKIAYKPDEVITEIEEIGEKIAHRFKEFCKDYGRELELWFEPGKFLVSESGYFLVKTNVVKQTTSTVFAGVDSGFNHLIRPKLYDAYHHIVNVSNVEGKQRVYSVVGYICETDTFAMDRKLSEVHEGDILCFLNAGAYAFSMSSNYNSRFRPAEVMIKDGKATLIRRRENLQDLLATMENL
ncbi:MAG: diaminopimelate decarboxylase [Bacteroidia bacterium]|nr:diaminopimelate decarboxylase [Bacteroidota bacterium]MCZ2130689.1 diaminopimelate decarboxylase [Bacteroidia bacterium]